MTKPRMADVLSHWHKPFIDFQTSALDFYATVEEGLKKREIPDVSVSRVTLREAGFGSAKRVYLRVKRKGLAFDVGAAPFGTGYFFSWWMAHLRPARWLGILLLVALIFAMPWATRGAFKIVQLVLKLVPFLGSPRTEFFWNLMYSRIPVVGHTPYYALVFIGTFLALRAIAARFFDFDGLLSAAPVFGRVYRWVFVSDTYYTADTALTYQAVVKSVVEDAIDGVTSAKGLRALTDDEKKPRMENFYGR